MAKNYCHVFPHGGQEFREVCIGRMFEEAEACQMNLEAWGAATRRARRKCVTACVAFLGLESLARDFFRPQKWNS
jgi:hypothetical protein